MGQAQQNYVQVPVEVPIELANYLNELTKIIGANRRSLVRSMLIQSIRKVQLAKEAPSTLGDVENAIIG